MAEYNNLFSVKSERYRIPVLRLHVVYHRLWTSLFWQVTP